MHTLSHALLEFLHSIPLDDGGEGVNIEEAAVRVATKFGARMQANRKAGKKLSPSKYLKKYGTSWQKLNKEEVDVADTERKPNLIAKYSKKNKETAAIRRVGIDGSLQSAESFLPEAEKRVAEEVKPAKGTKKDKRSDIEHKALPTMPYGMNAGQRMMPEETLIAETSKDRVLAAYKERYHLARAHDVIGDKKETAKNAKKAVKHADYYAKHDENAAKYARVASARAFIAKRNKQS